MINKYQNGKIYKLINKLNNEMIYIGSTINTLKKRFQAHKTTFKKKKIFKIYQYINELGIDNIDIQLIENYPCNNKIELLQREEYYICLYKELIMNKIKAYWSNEEKQQYFKKYNKEYRIINNKELKLYDKIKYINHIEKYKNKSKLDRINNKDRHKCLTCFYNTCSKTDLTRHYNRKKHIDNVIINYLNDIINEVNKNI